MTKGTLDRAARKARRDEVRACHEAGLSIREISERLEVLKRTVRRIVHRLDSEPPGAAALKARNAALAAYFKAGHTVSEAAAHFGLSRAGTRRLLQALVPEHMPLTKKARRAELDSQSAAMAAYYQAKHALRETAKQFGISSMFARQILQAKSPGLIRGSGAPGIYRKRPFGYTDKTRAVPNEIEQDIIASMIEMRATGARWVDVAAVVYEASGHVLAAGECAQIVREHCPPDVKLAGRVARARQAGS